MTLHEIGGARGTSSSKTASERPPRSSQRPSTPRIDLLGCPFDPITEREVVHLVFAWKDAPTRETHHIITVNVAILMMAKDDPKLTNAIEKADLVVVDGKPLVWTSRWLDAGVPEKVSGVDLMRRLLEAGNQRGLSVFLLGTTQERLDVLERVIRAKYPNVVIAGTRNGYFKEPDYPAVTKQIREGSGRMRPIGPDQLPEEQMKGLMVYMSTLNAVGDVKGP